MRNILGFTLWFGLIVAVLLGVYWGMWALWCAVLPYFWATGPENILRPNFWMFIGLAFLFSWLGRLIFPIKSKD